MVEEYVKDLYRIGLILFATPTILMLLAILVSILGLQIDWDTFNKVLGVDSVALSGLLIMLYLSVKYYYKEGRYGKSKTHQ